MTTYCTELQQLLANSTVHDAFNKLLEKENEVCVGYVYVFHKHNSRKHQVKIGYTTDDTMKRLKAFEKKTGEKYTMLLSMRVNNCKYAEKLLHTVFKPVKMTFTTGPRKGQREWFDIDALNINMDLKSVYRTMVQICEISNDHTNEPEYEESDDEEEESDDEEEESNTFVNGYPNKDIAFASKHYYNGDYIHVKYRQSILDGIGLLIKNRDDDEARKLKSLVKTYSTNGITFHSRNRKWMIDLLKC